MKGMHVRGEDKENIYTLSILKLFFQERSNLVLRRQLMKSLIYSTIIAETDLIKSKRSETYCFSPPKLIRLALYYHKVNIELMSQIISTYS